MRPLSAQVPRSNRHGASPTRRPGRHANRTVPFHRPPVREAIAKTSAKMFLIIAEVRADAINPPRAAALSENFSATTGVQRYAAITPAT